MALRVTTLIEDSAGEQDSLVHEHGLYFFIEKDGLSLLFDTGQSGAFVQNARRLGTRLEDLEIVALSHGHYDHTGGVLALADTARNFELYLKECIFQKKMPIKTESMSSKVTLSRKKICASWGFLSNLYRQIVPGCFQVYGC